MPQKGMVAVLVGVLLAIGLSVDVTAGSPKKLRWIPSSSDETPRSGPPLTVEAPEHVRVNKTMSTMPEDRHYAIRGMRFAGGSSRAVSAVPAFLHPDADRDVRVDWYGDNDISNEKVAELPAGYFVTSVQVCDDDRGVHKELKGLRVWGHKLDDLGRPIQPTGPVEVKKPACKKWRTKVSCPTGTIAHSYKAYRNSNSSISLVCAKVEPDVGAYNPFTAKGGSGSVFNTGAKKLYLAVDVKNDSHTTGSVDFVDVKVMKAGQVLYQAKKTNPFGGLPYGNTREVKFPMAASWADIQQAGGCKVGDTCTVNIKGTIKATVQGLQETHEYTSSVSIFKN